MSSSAVTGAEVLAVPLRVDGDSGVSTVRAFLVELARMVWFEGESFSGKRPFGNSSWECEVYAALADVEMISVSLDHWGDEVFDETEGDRLIELALTTLAG